MRGLFTVETHADWFADEIAIDFPSIGPAVARMREAFLRADMLEMPHEAEVRLSAREASHGVIVPLDVPLRRMCAYCGGRGETWMESCVCCGGTGEAVLHHRVSLSVPPGVSDGDMFCFSVAMPSAPATRIAVRVAVLSHPLD
jgi:hypothetical protein